GEVGADRAVPDDDHLAGAHGLVVNRAAERPPEVVGPVAVVNRHQQRERLAHMRNSPSILFRMRATTGCGTCAASVPAARIDPRGTFRRCAGFLPYALRTIG